METRIPSPTPDEVRWHMQQARRLRSETVHRLLRRAGAWLSRALRGPAPARPVTEGSGA
jgi:hypothetical protein